MNTKVTVQAVVEVLCNCGMFTLANRIQQHGIEIPYTPMTDGEVEQFLRKEVRDYDSVECDIDSIFRLGEKQTLNRLGGGSMNESVWVVMVENPPFISIPKPVMVCPNRLDALNNCKTLNANAKCNHYYIEKAERSTSL
jgi:hypothetical protein